MVYVRLTFVCPFCERRWSETWITDGVLGPPPTSTCRYCSEDPMFETKSRTRKAIEVLFAVAGLLVIVVLWARPDAWGSALAVLLYFACCAGYALLALKEDGYGRRRQLRPGDPLREGSRRPERRGLVRPRR